MAGLFGEVLGLGAEARLARVELVAVDGTRSMPTPAAIRIWIAREILEEAKAVDAAEDELYGQARGDELPPELATARAARLAARGQAPSRPEARR
jgi:hypothetical protein